MTSVRTCYQRQRRYVFDYIDVLNSWKRQFVRISIHCNHSRRRPASRKKKTRLDSFRFPSQACFEFGAAFVGGAARLVRLTHCHWPWAHPHTDRTSSLVQRSDFRQHVRPNTMRSLGGSQREGRDCLSGGSAPFPRKFSRHMQNRSADIPTKDNRCRVKMIYFRFVRCSGKKQIAKTRSRIFRLYFIPLFLFFLYSAC